ncbi:inovirus-type Gp2 protein [Chromobacterium vaccinii]|uniref:YagK/YfjJ domain-containing protein n=1 Tax=Chromobacterium vaccinii TaxID=1108595 RepID=UPI001E2CB56D|nr:inovirus-type Gp2 protein [Chromobacterium vaccinii]MCD4499672.1 inovirus Gp2 family protein [Chromobacterium vaccinii]
MLNQDLLINQSTTNQHPLIESLKQNSYKRVLAIRIDLGMREEHQLSCSFIEFHEYKNRLWNNRRHNKIFQHCIGWIWKIEYTQKCNYHCHCLLFYDADIVRSDIYYGNKIGRYWVKNITEEKGTYHNCNRHKERYKHLGIGKINLNNAEGLDNLNNSVISYLTKEDTEIRNALTKEFDALNLTAPRVRTYGYSNNY